MTPRWGVFKENLKMVLTIVHRNDISTKTKRKKNNINTRIINKFCVLFVYVCDFIYES